MAFHNPKAVSGPYVTIVKNKEGEVSSCDIAYTDDIEQFNTDCLQYTKEVHDTCSDYDLSENYKWSG